MTVKTEKITFNADRNVTLVTMIQAVEGEWGLKERPGILILPGGGYFMCSDREAEAVAYPYLAAGFHAFVLRYSVGEHKTWPNPLNDYEQAMTYIRNHAGEWNLIADKIAVLGFSAGGHLAATAATQAQNRPNAAILIYAALEQDISSACQPGTGIPAPVDHVDAKTPPCFLASARDDSVVPISNNLNFMAALDKYGITCECHIYPYSNHGFSTGESQLAGEGVCSRVRHWVQDSIGFLWDVFGTLTPNGMGKPHCPEKIHANFAPYLSVQCTLAHLRRFASAVPELDETIGYIDAAMGQLPVGREIMQLVADRTPIAMAMTRFGKNTGDIAALDKVLCHVQNG